jgi:hypothetical protein
LTAPGGVLAKLFALAGEVLYNIDQIEVSAGVSHSPAFQQQQNVFSEMEFLGGDTRFVQ